MAPVPEYPVPPVDASRWAALIRSVLGDPEPSIDAEWIVKSAAAAEEARQLSEFLTPGPVGAFINVVRQHPGIADWFSSNISNWEFGPDTERAAVIRQLLRRRQVSRYFRRKYVTDNGRDLEIRSLINAAERYIENEDERLDEQWNRATTSPVWNKLSRSKPLQRIAKDFYALLHAVAAERTKYGGPNVQITQRCAAAMLTQIHGYPCDYRDVGKAAHVLVRAGILPAISPGRSIASGEKPRTAIYHLLPEPRTVPSPFSEAIGLVAVGGGPGDEIQQHPAPPGDAVGIDRPRLADWQRHVLLAFFTGSEDSARGVIDEWEARQRQKFAPANDSAARSVLEHPAWQPDKQARWLSARPAITPMGEVHVPEPATKPREDDYPGADPERRTPPAAAAS